MTPMDIELRNQSREPIGKICIRCNQLWKLDKETCPDCKGDDKEIRLFNVYCGEKR